MKKQTKKYIYVIGYPKSGTTWMTRLLSQSLNIEVLKMGIHGYPEVASDTNKHLNRKKINDKYKLAKIHDTPSVLFKTQDQDSFRGVFVIRDFKDIVVSSLYYFTSNKVFQKLLDKKYDGKINPIQKILLDLKINKHASKIINGEIDHKIIWNDFIRAWEEAAKKQNLLISFVKYENLRKNPAEILIKTINEIELKIPNKKIIKKVVEFQSFKVSKKRKVKDKNLSNINDKLMRRGISGDWRKLLPNKSIDLINSKYGDTLKRWKYSL